MIFGQPGTPTRDHMIRSPWCLADSLTGVCWLWIWTKWSQWLWWSCSSCLCQMVKGRDTIGSVLTKDLFTIRRHRQIQIFWLIGYLPCMSFNVWLPYWSPNHLPWNWATSHLWFKDSGMGLFHESTYPYKNTEPTYTCPSDLRKGDRNLILVKAICFVNVRNLNSIFAFTRIKMRSPILILTTRVKKCLCLMCGRQIVNFPFVFNGGWDVLETLD